ncbi:MAG: ABC transporter substrate-binding protein [Alphaproteobacteria bacterium]|nr:ABC transporter substrate-binding protein [Alphaproteobacteria bacterium]
MSTGLLSKTIARRALLRAGAAGAAIGALPLTSPFIIEARGETPIKIGLIDPITGVYSAPAASEVEGAKFAVDEINQKGGILGRQVQLLVEDSANDVGTGVQKARKLIERDEVNFILADVNSAIAYAVAGVTNEKQILHIVPGGHTDPITGKDCKWNVFRVCNTTAMDANAIANTLIEKFGKKWYFLTPDYAYGHTLEEGFVRNLKGAGGSYEGDLLPIGTADFSAALIKAKSYGPNVLIDIMGGADQVNSLKQFLQFGLQNDMKVAGSLYELENMYAVPKEALIGWWVMEWWWNQPNVPHVAEFVAAIKKALNKTPTARHWFGYVSVHTCAIVANETKGLDAVKMAHALEGLKLPPEIALQSGDVVYRAGDHQLMSNIFVGEAHPAPEGGDPADMFRVDTIVPGEKAAGSAEATGCHVTWPS